MIFNIVIPNAYTNRDQLINVNKDHNVNKDQLIRPLLFIFPISSCERQYESRESWIPIRYTFTLNKISKTKVFPEKFSLNLMNH